MIYFYIFRVCWNFPNKQESLSLIRRIWHIFILVHITAFSSTLICALPESSDNIVDLGQDLLWIIGVCMRFNYFPAVHLSSNCIALFYN